MHIRKGKFCFFCGTRLVKYPDKNRQLQSNIRKVSGKLFEHVPCPTCKTKHQFTSAGQVVFCRECGAPYGLRFSDAF